MVTNLSTQGTDATLTSLVKFFAVVLMAAMIADLVSRSLSTSLSGQYMQSQMYQGVTDPRSRGCDSDLTTIDLVNEDPYTPWIAAQIINDGPDSVWVAVNDVTKKFEVKADETANINRIGAVERISYLYLICDAGEEAAIRITGEY